MKSSKQKLLNLFKKNFLNSLYIIFLGVISSYSLPPYNYFIINFITFSLFFIFIFNQKKKISNSKFTRIPIWQNVAENIVGILDSRSIIADKFSKKSLTKKEFTSFIKKPWFIPESTDLLDQLMAFKNKKEHYITDENRCSHI